ncbi:pantoate--beta-alanine ligase [Oceanospirillum maris]|uniref:pantoate--beta-alanine ligase n=1 Tax=Oceanospirillum maris TaxID=64977 RepID=UPI00040E65CB|nr:pantoate--beta-alanine ligase [Oceanospirillum maris]
MILCHSITELRATIAQRRLSEGGKVAFVPTMGNLHSGHIHLIHEAHKAGNIVVASIFVNPMQFGPNEDLESYPRTLQLDGEKLAEAGCHILFAPSANEIYPQGSDNHTQVCVPELGEELCGAARPGHFTGVTTVVSKLFNIVQPDVALFGQKDFQQLAIIRQMTQDLCLPIEIKGVPTVRGDSGLALSSRNGYLTDEERAKAPRLYQTLVEIRQSIESGESDFDKLCQQAKAQLAEYGFTPDYLSVRRQSDLKPAEAEDSTLVILAAAHLGKARLIDNIAFALDQK